MTIFTSLGEALANAPAATGLNLDTDESPHLWAAGDELAALSHIGSLKVVVADRFQDAVLRVVSAFPHVRELEMWGVHLPSGTLPFQIAELADLERLTIVSCGLSRIPATLGELPRLRHLALRHHRFEKFPPELIGLSRLETLEFSAAGRFETLPAELAALTGLRSLDLSWTLGSSREGIDDLDDLFDETPARPAPAVLSRLPALEHLDLSNCGIGDVSALGSMTRLRSLSLAGNRVADVSPLAALVALRTLDLSGCHSLRDIGALAALPLRELNLASSGVRSLAPLAEIVTLKAVNVEHCDDLTDVEHLLRHPNALSLVADDDLLDRWNRRADLTGLPSPDTIRALLAAPTAAEFERGVRALAAYVALTRGGRDGEHGFFRFFDLDPHGSGVTAVAGLDEPLTRFAPELTSDTLLVLLRTSYADHDDDFETTLVALRELVRRGDKAAQLTFLDILSDANRYYDAGHRAEGDTVYDALIDDVLPGFHPEVLAEALCRFDSDYLSSDGFFDFFEPALAGPLPEDLERRLLDRLREESLSGTYRFHEWCAVVAGLDESGLGGTAGTEVARLRAELTSIATILADLSRGRNLADHVDALAVSVPKSWLEVLDIALRDALVRHPLPPATLWAAIGRMVAAKWGARTVAGFLYPLVLHHFDAAVDEIRRARAADPERWKKVLKRLDQTPAPAKLVASLTRALKPGPETATPAPESAPADPYARFEARLADAEDLSTVDLARLVAEIGAVDGPTPPPEWLVDATAARTHNAIIRCLQHSDVGGARALAVAYAAVQPRHGHAERIREALTSMVLMAAMLGDDDDLAATALTWVPEHINLPNLAYNLACYHALHGGGPPMHNAVRHARRLGRAKEQFLADGDFAAFHDDPDFHAALDARPPR